MDNVTHTLAGLLLARLVADRREVRNGRPPSRTFERVAAVAGAVAANLPDADLLYAGPLLGQGPLGYLLHHRGHTHTVIVAVLGALLVWGAALVAWRMGGNRRNPVTTGDRWSLFVVCIAGTLSHLLLDYTNSYGVHPFWPLHDAWHYGDAVFILEPWLWVAAVPALLLAAHRAWARTILSLLLVIVLAAAWTVSMVPWGIALALTLAALAWAGLALTMRPTRRAFVAATAWLGVEAVFFLAAFMARTEIRRAATAAGSAPIADIVLTPSVSNPFCVDAIVVEADAATYRVTTAAVAPFSRIVPVGRCAQPAAGASVVTMTPSPRPTTAAVRWGREWSAPRRELVALARDNCVAAAALRFMRVPVWAPNGADVTLADLRYARGAGGGFGVLPVPAHPATCPAYVPSWTPPRAALLVDR